MPSLPAEFSYGTVKGKIVAAVKDTPSDPDSSPDSSAVSGNVVFTANMSNIVSLISDIVVIPQKISVALDNTGSFSVDLIATDDPDILPAGLTYTITFELVGMSLPSIKNIAVPQGTIQDIASYFRAAPGPGGSTAPAYTLPDLKGPPGDPGPPGGSDAETALRINTGAATQAAGDARWQRKTEAALAYAQGAAAGVQPDKTKVTQGLYSRTRPTPDGGVATITPLAMDTVTPNRMWSQGMQFGQLGYGPVSGASFTPVGGIGALPGGVGFPALMFSPTHVWLVAGPMSPNQGSVWRSPLPNATITGNFDSGLNFTKKFDIAAPPAGITPGANSFFRNASVATDSTGTKVMLLEYGTTIVGGTSIYYSTNSGDTWTKVKTWTNAKHGHAVRWFNNRFWVMLGDAGFSDLGLYSCDPASPTLWTRRSIYGPEQGGNYFYGINFFPIVLDDGKEVIVTEPDTQNNFGLLFYPVATPDGSLRAFSAPIQLSVSRTGTFRQFTYDPVTKNIYGYLTSEVGQLDSKDSSWMFPPPYRVAIELESFPFASSTETQGDPVFFGNEYWHGQNHFTMEKLLGQ